MTHDELALRMLQLLERIVGLIEALAKDSGRETG